MQAEAVFVKGKRCLVTGGSRGLGRAICLRLAQGGAEVAFTFMRDEEGAAATRSALERLGATPPMFRGSVSDAQHVSSTVKHLVELWGGIDVLINNAAINQMYPLALIEEADWDKMLSIDAKGAFLFSRACARHMIKARKGHILNLGSFASERMVESPVHYASAKAALRGLTESLALEVGRYNVMVNMLCPGLLEEGMSSGLPQHRVADYVAQCPLGRLGNVNEVANMAAFLVSDHNTFMTGSKIVMDGGI